MNSSTAGRRPGRTLVLIDLPTALGAGDPPATSTARLLSELREAVCVGPDDLIDVCCGSRAAFDVQAALPGSGLCLSGGERGVELMQRWPPDTVCRGVDRLVICSASPAFAPYAAECSRGGVACIIVSGVSMSPLGSGKAVHRIARPLPLHLRDAA